MNLVIVESPAKAKTINKYLGTGYEVLASYGHVRDLPSKDGSVLPDDDFSMHWEADAKGAKRLSEIAEAAKRADRVILATDPDREGEAISWHVLEVLNKKKVLKDTHVERVTFNAITKSAVLDAMANPRQIDMELVEAYLARRALDYLVGFTLSPVLWRKLPGARSAGRVQSVALRIVVDREMEIEKFKPQEYWSIEADLNADSPPFTARLVKHAGKRVQRLDIKDEATADAARAAIKAGDFTINSVEKKPVRRNPAPPFTTSTLQQEASRKLGFTAQRTMQAAQKLYEGVDETGGLITYMRTDGVSVSPEGLAQAREVIGKEYGPAYVPSEPRFYKVKAKNAQEAHEAIRPTNIARLPESVRLDSDLQRLYELIWKRMVASQMEAARLDRTTVEIETPDGQTGLRATGQVVTFDGFLAVYEEGRDEKQKGAEGDEGEDDASRLPALKEGAKAKVDAIRTDQHFTEPPPRYSEATLVKKLEELGIGRPSTYASTLSTLRDREYVRVDKNRFYPEDKGRLVTAFLEQVLRQMGRIRLHRRAGDAPGRGVGRRPELEGAAARVLAGLPRRDAGRRGTAHHRHSGRPERKPGRPYLPGQGRRFGPARMPPVPPGPAQPEDQPFRRLHRLLALSRLQIHPAPSPAPRQRTDRRKAATANWEPTPRPASRCN